MNGKLVFRKLVQGYRNSIKQKLEEEGGPIKIVYAPKTESIFAPISQTSTSILGERGRSEKIKIEEGIEIPAFKSKRVTTLGIEEEEIGTFEATYPLIPEQPTKDDIVFAFAKIGWDQAKNTYEYRVIEPPLTKKMIKLINRIKELLEEKLDIDFTKLKKSEAKDYLHKQIFSLLNYFGTKLTENEKKILLYFIDRDFLGLSIIEPLIHDPEIEDISCDGINIPVYVFHRNPVLGSIPTNIRFETEEQLDSYLARLAQLCGQSISVIDPLLDGSLPDGSRVQATLGTDIAMKGSNFTIRKFTKFPFTPTHLLNYETCDIKTLAFLWMAVDFGNSALISGGTATGKTVFLNVLSLFIKPDMKIVSIEDTPEIKLPHEHWVPHVARVPIATEFGKTRGEVDLFDLLKESLRQRPDYIIVGEVRGKEAYVLFQQMSTGHPSLATIHADSMEKLMDRLITPPIDLPPSLIEALDFVVFLTKMKYRGKYVRKIESIYEIVGFDFDKKEPIVNKIFEWNAENDKIEIKNKSTILKKIAKKTGLREKEILEELKRRMLILYWMKERNLVDYRDVNRVINVYYKYPESVIEIVSGEI